MSVLRRFRAERRWEVLHRWAPREADKCNCIQSKLLILSADRRVGYCFLQTIGGRCTARTSDLKTVTKADCCCTMGAAWGSHCEICPSKDSENYNELCLDKGFSITGQGARHFENTLTERLYASQRISHGSIFFSDIDECRTIPGLCRNGMCINTLGSYRCVCNKGYKADQTGTQCVGKRLKP